MTTKTLDRNSAACTPTCAPTPESTGETSQACDTNARPPARLPVVTPRADMWETADAAHLAIELPGVRPDDLDVRIEADRLTVRATAHVATPDGAPLAAEWRPRSYERTFSLTDDADRAGIDAHLRHGLLLVTVPRRAERRPRSIPVRVVAD